MTDEPTTSISVPLDSDGFLRRECPTCEREFKWLPSDDAEPAEPGGYFCPYCGVQALEDEWLTKAQVELARETVARDIVGPMMEDFARRVGGRYESNVPGESAELTEDDDMRRVDFACHPGEPLKVLDDWSAPVYCLICGEASSV
jgi:hypothetical protein